MKLWSTESARISFYSIFYAYISLFLYGMIDNIRGPIYPELLKRFSIDHSTGSWFFSLASFSILVAAYFSPWLLRSQKYIVIFRLSLFLTLLSQVVFYFSDSFYGFLLGATLMGFGVGPLTVLQNVLVMKASSPHNLSRIMNGLHANYGGASLFAPLVVAFAIQINWGYQAAFLISSAFALGVFLISFATPHLVDIYHKVDMVKNESIKKNHISINHAGFASILALYVAAEVLLGTRLSYYLIDIHGFNQAQASVWVSYFFLALFISRIGFTFVKVPISHRALLLVMMSLSFLVMLLSAFVDPTFFILTGFTMGPIYALSISLAKDQFPEELESVSAAAVVLSGVAIVSMHSLVGWVTDLYGIKNAMLIAPLLLILSVGFLLRSKNKVK